MSWLKIGRILNKNKTKNLTLSAAKELSTIKDVIGSVKTLHSSSSAHATNWYTRKSQHVKHLCVLLFPRDNENLPGNEKNHESGSEEIREAM